MGLWNIIRGKISIGRVCYQWHQTYLLSLWHYPSQATGPHNTTSHINLKYKWIFEKNIIGSEVTTMYSSGLKFCEIFQGVELGFGLLVINDNISGRLVSYALRNFFRWFRQRAVFHCITPLATKIQYQRYGLVCKGNPTFESCVEGKSWGRANMCTLGSPFRSQHH